MPLDAGGVSSGGSVLTRHQSESVVLFSYPSDWFVSLPPDNIYECARRFFCQNGENSWATHPSLDITSAKPLENFNDFLKFSDNSADNTPACDPKGGGFLSF